MSSKQVAKAAKCDISHIYRIRQGLRCPTGKLARALSKLLEFREEEKRLWESLCGGTAASVRQSLRSEVAPSPSRPWHADDYDLRTVALLNEVEWRSTFDRELIAKFSESIVKHVVQVWAASRPYESIARRGPDHSLAMLQILIDDYAKELAGLTVQEWRVLLAGIWVHDVGLAVAARDLPEDLALREYPDRSEEHFLQHRNELGIDEEEEANAVAHLCRFSRNETPLQRVKIESSGVGLAVERQKTLIALLRLANMAETRYERVSGLLPPSSPLPRDFEAELVRNYFVTRVERIKHTLRAEVIWAPRWDSAEKGAIAFLKARLERDLQGELNRIKDVLAANLKSTILLWTEVKHNREPNAEEETRLKQVLERLGTARSPNAARVLSGLMERFEHILQDGAFEVVWPQTEAAMKEALKMFSHQAQLLNLQRDLTEASTLGSVQALIEVISQYRVLKAQAYAAIRQNAMDAFGDARAFVLFGYSGSCLEALRELPDSTKSSARMLVLECRNKTVYGPDNTIEYSDGAAYARKLREFGYEDVNLVTDASAAYIFSPEVGRMPSAAATHVVLGADSVDPSGFACCTVGSAPLAAAATSAGATVWVLTEGGKVRSGVEWYRQEKSEAWLALHPTENELLDQSRIPLVRPMNEKVPSEHISYFVTERGRLKPGELRSHYGENWSVRVAAPKRARPKKPAGERD